LLKIPILIKSGRVELLTYMGKTRNPYKVLMQKPWNGRGHFGHLDINHIFLSQWQNYVCDGVSWVELAQNWTKWHDLCEILMNLQITQFRLSWPVEQTSTDKERCCTIQFISVFVC